MNDDCSTAITITGVGTTPFDTTGAASEGFDGGGGNCAGSANNQDIFWQWTVPTSGDYQFDTDTSSYDTKLSIHNGIGCAATCVAYDDDGGAGLQSSIQLLGLVAGDTYLIQTGGYAANAGPGVLNISTYVDPCAGSDDSYEENDDCTSAAAVTDGTYPALFVSQTDPDHYLTCVDDGGTIDVSILFQSSLGDCDLFLWDAADYNCGTGYGTTDLANGFSTSDDEYITWTNSTGADMDVIIEVNVWTGSSSACNNYDLVIAGSGTCDGSTSAGTPFCDPGSDNSTGAPAILAGTWGTGVGSDLHLEITSGVPGQLAYMLVGNVSTAGVAVSNGLFCLIGSGPAQFFRYNVGGTDMNSIGGFDATGTMINSVGTSTTGFGFDVPSTIPASPLITIMAGDTWNFQGWYRDTPAGVGTSNFTNGLSVTF